MTMPAEGWHTIQPLYNTLLSPCAFSCSFSEPEWLHDRDEPFLHRRDRLPEPAEEPKRLGIRDFIRVDAAIVCHSYGLKNYLPVCVAKSRFSFRSGIMHFIVTIPDHDGEHPCSVVAQP